MKGCSYFGLINVDRKVANLDASKSLRSWHMGLNITLARDIFLLPQRWPVSHALSSDHLLMINTKAPKLLQKMQENSYRRCTGKWSESSTPLVKGILPTKFCLLQPLRVAGKASLEEWKILMNRIQCSARDFKGKIQENCKSPS